MALNIGEEHKTSANIEKRKAFTLAIADKAHIKEAGYFGTATASKVANKFEKTGMHATKSSKVDAPIIDEFPVSLECRVVEMHKQPCGLLVLGEIVGVLAEESTLDEKNKVDAKRLDAFLFDQLQNRYYSIGEDIGGAWDVGRELLK